MLQGTQTLASLLRSAASTLASTKSDTQSAISANVGTLNSLSSAIADLNKKIDASTEGTEAYNSLLDSRDALIEQVSALVDVNVVDNGSGNLSVYLASGQTVVDGTTGFTFSYEQGQTVRQLSSTSIANRSDVQCYSSGTDSSEYTIKVVSNGGVGSGAAFEVSLDGGKTWLTDDDGKVLTYSANAEDGKVTVGDLEIWFGTTSNAGSSPTSDLEVGDTFTLVPKKALYWYTSAGTPELISPQQYADGTDNARRLTGGTLCGELELADTYVGGYRDSLDSLTQSMMPPDPSHRTKLQKYDPPLRGPGGNDSPRQVQGGALAVRVRERRSLARPPEAALDRSVSCAGEGIAVYLPGFDRSRESPEEAHG